MINAIKITPSCEVSDAGCATALVAGVMCVCVCVRPLSFPLYLPLGSGSGSADFSRQTD